MLYVETECGNPPANFAGTAASAGSDTTGRLTSVMLSPSDEQQQEQSKSVVGRRQNQTGLVIRSGGSPSNNAQASTVASGKRTTSKFAADFRARHWSYLFETLRRTVDAIYETCRSDRSIIECKEAHMILTHYAKDFESLINCLNVEDLWALSEKPTAVAWEIRKTVGSPSKPLKSHGFPSNFDNNDIIKLIPEPPKKQQQSDAGGNKLEVTQCADPGSDNQKNASGSYADKVRSPVSTEDKGRDETLQENKETEDEGWNLVNSKGRRRRVKSQSTSVTAAGHWREMTGGNFMNPRTAMDIPQTRASMAKMAYSRRLIWEKKQTELQEKLFAQQRSNQQPRKAGSFPALNRIGINFADPRAVKRSAKAYRATLEQRRTAGAGGSRKGKYRSFQSVESLHSLGSIKETDEENNNILKEHSVLEEKSSLPIRPDESGKRVEGSEWKEVQSLPANLSERRSSVSTKEEEEDDAWQHLTEEEESLAQEEESLQKEIEEEERKSIDAEMERHAAEAAASQEATGSSETHCQKLPVVRPMAWQDIVARWQVESHILATVNWGQLVETELSEVRQPGQAAQMHEKLSSPSRKRNLEDMGKRHEEKLAKADELRHKLMQEQAQRLKELSKRVEEVRAKRQELMEKKRILMETRMAKAAENREQQLQAIVRKAKDEEDKVLEIAFINNLEADGRRHDVMVRHQDHEQRLLCIQEERQRKVEEKVAREHAAEERRKVAAEERACRLRELAEKKRKRQEQIEQQKTEHEKERQMVAKEKAREREGRLAEIKAAKEANTEELKHRILQKQEKTSRRYEENLEQIKLRASEMSGRAEACVSESALSEWTGPPSSQPYPCLKLCSLCRVLIPSDLHLVAHLKSPKHSASVKDKTSQQNVSVESESFIVDLPADHPEFPSNASEDKGGKNGNAKKRRQKLRQKMLMKFRQYESQKEGIKKQAPDSPHKNRMQKVVSELKTRLESNGTERVWLSTDVHFLERSMGEMSRLMLSEGSTSGQQEAFWDLGGAELMLKILSSSERQAPHLIVPLRSITNSVNLLKTSVSGIGFLCVEILYSNKLATVIDALAYQMKNVCSSEESAPSSVASFVVAMIQLIEESLSEILSFSSSNSKEWKNVAEGEEGFISRTALLGSYFVVSGLMDCIISLIHKWRDTGERLDERNEKLLLEVMNLLRVFLRCFLCRGAGHDSFSKNGVSLDNGGMLVGVMRSSRLCGLLSFLYSELLNPNVSGDRQTPPELSEFSVQLAQSVLSLLNALAALSHASAQEILCCEYTSLEFRHIVSFLISYSSRHQKEALLHQAIVAVGHFVCQNWDNQLLVQSGTQPSILHQLCVLPFCYFSDPKLTKILFPTLIACTYKHESNREILEEELNGILLAGYLEDESVSADKNENRPQDLSDLKWRFPIALWGDAKNYFDSPVTV